MRRFPSCESLVTSWVSSELAESALCRQTSSMRSPPPPRLLHVFCSQSRRGCTKSACDGLSRGGQPTVKGGGLDCEAPFAGLQMGLIDLVQLALQGGLTVKGLLTVTRVLAQWLAPTSARMLECVQHCRTQLSCLQHSFVISHWKQLEQTNVLSSTWLYLQSEPAKAESHHCRQRVPQGQVHKARHFTFAAVRG